MDTCPRRRTRHFDLRTHARACVDTNGHAAAAGTREAGRSIHLQVGLEQSDATPLRLQCAAWWACGVWPGGTWVAHGQAGGELQSRKYDERWRDEGLSCTILTSRHSHVYTKTCSRAGGQRSSNGKLRIHNIYKFQRLPQPRRSKSLCVYRGLSGRPLPGPAAEAHRGPGIRTRLGPLSALAPPPLAPRGPSPWSPHGTAGALVGSDQALCTSSSRVHQHPSLRPSSSTTFHLDKSSLSRRFIGD